ncbi:MAG: flavin reductase family protein [Chloroflexota bacterium]|nr:flavin reductase family protein [Chloroflexota bacterium]
MTDKIDVRPELWDNVFAPSSCLVIVTTVDQQGRVNAASYGTCTRVNHEPVYIAFTVNAGSDTHANVLATNQFVVNVVPFEQDMLQKTIVCGLPFKPGTNELERAGLTALASKTVRPPRIAECRSHFECQVAWTKSWSEPGMVLERMMVVGKVTAVSIDQDCLDGQGFIVWDKVKPAHYCGSHYKNSFVAAYQRMEADWHYDGRDEEFREGRDWRTMFRR